jgi:hypothetical protein
VLCDGESDVLIVTLGQIAIEAANSSIESCPSDQCRYQQLLNPSGNGRDRILVLVEARS